MDIDQHTTEDILRIINQEDQKVPSAVAKEIPQIAKAVDLVAEALKKGGRLIYVGSGSSGRMGFLDASECPPTYSVSPELVQGVIAGGVGALYKSVEASEDNHKAGAAAMKRRRLGCKDVVAGISASGRTPYTVGAMRYGRSVGAKVISISCSPNSEMAEIADVSIAPVVGPEVVTGSTRMKSGTAQKLVLNMITTSTMIKLGYVYSNLMINVRMENSKLQERGRRIIMSATGVDYKTAGRALEKASGDLKVAIVMLQRGESRKGALQRLKRLNMNLRAALRD
jgi:N-acetylmuramic acid 6-phosphate etherase